MENTQHYAQSPTNGAAINQSEAERVASVILGGLMVVSALAGMRKKTAPQTHSPGCRIGPDLPWSYRTL